MNAPLVNKILALALDKAAPEGEAVCAFLKLRSLVLGAGATLKTSGDRSDRLGPLCKCSAR